MRRLTAEPILFDDHTTREGLVEIILGMIEERNNLCDSVDDLAESSEEKESAVETMRCRLEEVADFMADTGQIHNTPSAKFQWMNG